MATSCLTCPNSSSHSHGIGMRTHPRHKLLKQLVLASHVWPLLILVRWCLMRRAGRGITSVISIPCGIALLSWQTAPTTTRAGGTAVDVRRERKLLLVV